MVFKKLLLGIGKKLHSTAKWIGRQKISVKALLCAAVSAVILICIPTSIALNKHNLETRVTTYLEKIIKINELSTYKMRYGGVATSFDEKDPSKIDYHVSYEADVYAGIDFEEVKVTLDKKTKTVHITIPKAYITDTIIDMSSLDSLFVDKKENKSGITEKQQELCEADIKLEKNHQQTLIDFAEKSAINMLEALTKPIIESLGRNYSVKIERSAN